LSMLTWLPCYHVYIGGYALWDATHRLGRSISVGEVR
jgi:hypothetical protein